MRKCEIGSCLQGFVGASGNVICTISLSSPLGVRSTCVFLMSPCCGMKFGDELRPRLPSFGILRLSSPPCCCCRVGLVALCALRGLLCAACVNSCRGDGSPMTGAAPMCCMPGGWIPKYISVRPFARSLRGDWLPACECATCLLYTSPSPRD